MSGPAPSIDRGGHSDSAEPLEASRVLALIPANAFLEEELERTRAMLSRGYVRGRVGRSGAGP
jgi:hypothetical protein